MMYIINKILIEQQQNNNPKPMIPTSKSKIAKEILNILGSLIAYKLDFDIMS